jgi:hypothetical protein
MPRNIYTQVLQTSHAILKEHYRLVDSPIEAPGKETFGDVDIVVLDPKPDSPLNGITLRPQLATQLSTYLGAKHFILEKGNPTFNFAIPWPTEENHDEDLLSLEEQKYVQLDVKVCESEKMFEWELFHAAHGDLWNILGSTIRRFGLTVNNLGMHIRIPEMESFDRKKSMVFLTDESRRILEFLGLDAEKWWKEFGSREEMFEYAAGCRMFWVEDVREVDDSEGRPVGGMEGQDVIEQGKKKLKHNDRARMAKRPTFRAWMDEYLPRCLSEGRYMSSPGITRQQFRDEAFVQFDPTVKITYETRQSEWILAKHKDDIRREAIKGSVPEDVDPQFRAASIRTLTGVVMEGDTFKGMAVPEVAVNEKGFWDVDSVRLWVAENWKEAGEIGWARQQQRAMDEMKAKAKN